MEFNCIIERESFQLNVTGKSMIISNKSIQYRFDLSLRVVITWLFRESEISGFLFENLVVEGDGLNMKKLKQFLGGKITFSGIQIFYSFLGEINVNKNKVTKVCTLMNRQTKLKFSCKCFKKSATGIEKIHKEIEILQKASKNGLAPKIYECFESTNCVYVIMENLERIKDFEFIDDDIRNLIQTIASLHKENIAHKSIKMSHILFTEENKLKLVGFGQANNTNIKNNEFRLDIFKIGIIMYKFYQKQNFQVDQSLVIPDEGNSLLQSLLEWGNDEPFQLNLLLSHPYFKFLKNEGIPLCISIYFILEIQCMSPKFKTQVYQDENEELIL
ncbi:unnamed protein product (macronuclear) [Paramecium tetraurelia]|uniref:Protein kinase domain-containing protein n=1 Tax=Paramecium tetraurelia TaxID=5888 RepID=A0D0Q7_PARTE|nr:uncharacterized protein GSPATT00012176001 [Paramecium tetraurelia]CAK76624.1 unnamed protein product [Paramecium tetraurelia]|eukprot:XP_001444021.1 hypothetical protein (macronuclear) [Paramecium tetraurelia strain d4-2]